MFLLTLCLVGTALAAPAANPEALFLPAESHVLVSPYITYPDPMLPLRTLDIAIEPEPKDENAEIPEPKEEFEEPKEEFPETEESKEALKELPAAFELPKPETPKPLIVRLDVPIRPPSFITNWINSLPISLPNFPNFIGNWFHPTANPTRVLYNPGHYMGYPGAVIVEAPRA